MTNKLCALEEVNSPKLAPVSPRRALLQEAADTIDGDRNATYGGPEQSFTMIARFWSIYLGIEIAPYDVGAMMGLFKTARIKASTGTHKDSWLDLAGYAGCGWETVEQAK